MSVLLLVECQLISCRRSPDPSSGSKKCRRWVSTTSSIGSPLAAWVRGLSRATTTDSPPRGLLLDPLERLRADVGRELLGVLGHRRRRGDRGSGRHVGAERLDAARRSTVMRRSAGASDTSAASSMSSGRMPSTTLRPSKPRSRGRAATHLGRHRQAEVGELDGEAVAVGAAQRGVDQVHRRRADEAGDEEVDGVLVERLRACRPAGARPCASRPRGRPSSSPRSGRG